MSGIMCVYYCIIQEVKWYGVTKMKLELSNVNNVKL